MARIIEPSEYQSKGWKCKKDEYAFRKRYENCRAEIILGIPKGTSVIDALDSKFGKDTKCLNCGLYAFRAIPSVRDCTVNLSKQMKI